MWHLVAFQKLQVHATQGQSRAAHGTEHFKDGEKRKELTVPTAVESQQVDKLENTFPHPSSAAGSSRWYWTTPVSGRGQKRSATEGTSWPALGR